MLNISNNDFDEDFSKHKEDEKNAKTCRCLGKKSRFRKCCICFDRYFKNIERDDENETSFISQEFSSGESEKEEDMVNYID